MRNFLLFLISLVFAVVPSVVSAQHYTLLETKTFDIINKYAVQNNGGSVATRVTAKILIGGSSESLYQQKVRFRVIPTQTSKSVDGLGNIYCTVDLGNLNPGEKKYIIVEKVVKNSGITFNDDIYQMRPDYAEFLAQPGNKQYVLPSKNIESDAPEIKAEATHINIANPVAQQAKDIHLGVNVFLDYTLDETYAHRGALNALRTHKGVCTEFAGLFVAFCRAVGIPARVVNGYWLHNDTPMQVNVPVDVHGVRHAWAEFYLPDVGWVPAELTALQYVQYPNAAVQRYSNADSFAKILPNGVFIDNVKRFCLQQGIVLGGNDRRDNGKD
ncbi:MAG TPA: transglutaminase-like domain-containing protein, partial [Armatimonadota bacterium]|nr:transglutaminase-like domain-containing protein [Armatimonadota bacterium]